MKRCKKINTCGGNQNYRRALVYGHVVNIPSGYGLLYNWYAATDPRGVAPSGFRVPNFSDHEILAENEASALKSGRTLADGDPYWEGGGEGDNALDWRGQPAGRRSSNVSSSQYSWIRKIGYYWQTEEFVNPALVQAGILLNSSNTFTITGTYLKGFGFSIRCVSDNQPPSAVVQDIEGNEYSWVQIGPLYWLQQNLKTTKYNNGDDIPTGLSDAQWQATNEGAWSYPNGDPNLPI